MNGEDAITKNLQSQVMGKELFLHDQAMSVLIPAVYIV